MPPFVDLGEMSAIEVIDHQLEREECGEEWKFISVIKVLGGPVDFLPDHVHLLRLRYIGHLFRVVSEDPTRITIYRFG